MLRNTNIYNKNDQIKNHLLHLTIFVIFVRYVWISQSSIPPSLTSTRQCHLSCGRHVVFAIFIAFTAWLIRIIIIHQTHYEKSDWSRAFNQFTIACELDMINVISAADIIFIMSSSTSAWLLSPLECSQKQNAERFTAVSEDELCEKCIIKQLLNSVFAWYHELSNPHVCVICLSLRLRQITQTSVLIIHDIMLNLIQ